MQEMRSGPNYVKVTQLRTLAGRGNFVAGIVPTWRPFLQQLFAAIYERTPGEILGHVFKARVSHALAWLAAFLAGSNGTLERTFTVASWLREDAAAEVYLDASPWGFGA